MCGIAGSVVYTRNSENSLVQGMLGTLAHRGPDGFAIAGDQRCRLGLSRLAILDLASPATPFVNENGTVFCVCNGEIFNSIELRLELEAKGHRFATGIDTEVILHLWEEVGTDLVQRLDGMFAFAVWDARSETLMLGRDRAGEKPLYYYADDERVLFSSEIRGLLAHPAVPASLAPEALVEYLAHGFIPAPLSPIGGILKLPGAHVLVAQARKITVSRYWDLADHFSPPSQSARSTRDIAAELDHHLLAACRRRSRSDVPFGVFLSGGIDSSCVLSCLSEIHGAGLPAFTLGHDDQAFDESQFAVPTARHLGAELHRLVVSRGDLEEGLAQIGRRMDEPLGDSSTIPTFLLARFASQHVKVVLSGEGADELFGGYPTYLGHRLADWFTRIPAGLRRPLVSGIRKLLPVSMGNVSADYLFERFISAVDLDTTSRHEVWFGCVDRRQMPGLLSPQMLQALGDRGVGNRVPYEERRLPDRLSELLYLDFTRYLQDDLFTKIDRATMMASIESRSAFVDQSLAEFAAGIPSHLKVSGFTTKKILRLAVKHRLPPAVLRRRKRGFNIPFSRWVLEGLADDLRRRFARERVNDRGLFRSEGINHLIDEHVARRADHRRPLFALLAFDLWCDRTFGEGAAVPFSASSTIQERNMLTTASVAQ